MRIARAEFGVSEKPGSDHNPRILAYHATTSLAAKEDEVSWCSSFVNFCVTESGRQGTNSAAARSWLSWKDGEPVSPIDLRYGDIVVFARGSQPWQGHVAFAVFRAGSHVWHLGGNQGNKVCVSATPISKLLGVRR